MFGDSGSADKFANHEAWRHYFDVIMTTVASQITSLTIVYSTVYSDADQRKHQSSASLAFVWGIHRDRWIPRTKGQLRGKCFHLMTSSWHSKYQLWAHLRVQEHRTNVTPQYQCFTFSWRQRSTNFILCWHHNTSLEKAPLATMAKWTNENWFHCVHVFIRI